MLLLGIWGLAWGSTQRGAIGAGMLGLGSLPGGEKLEGELCRENRLQIRFGVSRRRSG